MSPWLIILSVISLTLQPSFCLNPEQPGQSSKVCDNQSCREVSAKLLASMDATVDPCNSFFRFACGRWARTTPQPKHIQIRWNNQGQLFVLTQSRLRDELQSEPALLDSRPVKLMKQFYKTCIDQRASETDAISKILGILHETGGWPMVMGANQWNENSRTWQSLEEYYSNIQGHSVFYSIDLTPGSLSTLYTLTIKNQPAWPDKIRDLKTYKNLLKKVAEAVIGSINTNVPSEQLDEDINDLVKLEHQIYEAYRDKTQVKTVTDSDKFIQEFNSLTQNYGQSRIDWKGVFQKILAITNVKPSIVNSLTIKPLEYFVELARILKLTSKRTIVNYIHWKFLSGILPHATEKMENLYYKILHNVLNVDRKAPRWEYCVNQIGRNYASYSLFIKKYYREKSRQNADKLYNEIKTSLKKQIDNSNWVPSRVKNDVKTKINDLSATLAYSTFYDNDQQILAYFEGLTMSDSYFTNNLNYAKYMWKREIKFWGQPASAKEILDDPLSLRAHYERRRNMFILSPTHVQSPLLDGTLPNYVTYGALGSLMGHEMGHLLDYNSFRSLLAGVEARTYDEIAKCFIDVYNSYFSRGQQVGNCCAKGAVTRGESTRNENMADWNGLQSAYQAYKKMRRDKLPNGEAKLPGLRTYTDDQMFFISYAQSWCSADNYDYKRTPHAPDYLRINGPLSNNADFSAAFNCKANSTMHPATKCNVWMK